MKVVNTTASTGDKIKFGSYVGTVGNIKNGFISVSFKVTENSCITAKHSVRDFNKQIKLNKYILVTQ